MVLRLIQKSTVKTLQQRARENTIEEISCVGQLSPTTRESTNETNLLQKES
jgi:hypothetical protein